MAGLRANIYHPVFIRNNKKLKHLLGRKEIYFNDIYEYQLKELYVIKNPRFASQDKKVLYNSKDYVKFANKLRNKFVYVYYPWNNTLVRTVGASEYYLLKTNRNRDLITEKEQEDLYKLKIAVLGMSVGSNIAFVLTQAGISREIFLADFDYLDTTNLNRIWAGVHQVGLNKAVIAARRIYEDNPFAKVRVFTKGIDARSLEKLLEKKKIDCIIEEIDQMQMKITIRKLAIKHKVPVLMITDNGDRAVLHIERYDLGYKKIFGRDLNYWGKRMENYSGKKDFADIVINDIVGGSIRVDPKMLSSAKEVIEKKLVSWPQLGTSALLGGIAVTIAVKNIVSGKEKRKYVREYLKVLE
jgi:molybdopterin/thiamine biosynthesis adenylyltransferase